MCSFMTPVDLFNRFYNQICQDTYVDRCGKVRRSSFKKIWNFCKPYEKIPRYATDSVGSLLAISKIYAFKIALWNAVWTVKGKFKILLKEKQVVSDVTRMIWKIACEDYKRWKNMKKSGVFENNHLIHKWWKINGPTIDNDIYKDQAKKIIYAQRLSDKKCDVVDIIFNPKTILSYFSIDNVLSVLDRLVKCRNPALEGIYVEQCNMFNMCCTTLGYSHISDEGSTTLFMEDYDISIPQKKTRQAGKISWHRIIGIDYNFVKLLGYTRLVVGDKINISVRPSYVQEYERFMPPEYKDMNKDFYPVMSIRDSHMELNRVTIFVKMRKRSFLLLCNSTRHLDCSMNMSLNDALYTIEYGRLIDHTVYDIYEKSIVI